MRLLSYRDDGRRRVGLERDGAVIDLGRLAALAGLVPGPEAEGWCSARALLDLDAPIRDELVRLGEEHLALPGADDVMATAALELGPPVTDPEKIVCLGMNYREHAAEMLVSAPDTPILFAKYTNALSGTGAPIPAPSVTTQLDYEGELAIVIGRRARNVAAPEALDFVAGCMVMNDVSARDLQFVTSQWLAGKSLDGSAPCGPVLVSLDELGDPQDLKLTTRLNDVVVQEESTSAMIFPIVEIVAYVSSLMTLVPGDIIATGTPRGVGYKQVPPVFLKPGDQVEIEIDGLGVLRNHVVLADEERLSAPVAGSA